MKNTALLCATSLIVAGFFYFSVTAQSSNDKATPIAMTGDKDATWILTDQNKLIYCWWPESPDRRDQQASCRVLDKFRVDRIQ
jgi:hypothetical protein